MNNGERDGEFVSIEAFREIEYEGNLLVGDHTGMKDVQITRGYGEGFLRLHDVRSQILMGFLEMASNQKTSPDPTLLYTDYILQRPGRLCFRIQGKYTGLLHLESIFRYQPLANME